MKLRLTTLGIGIAVLLIAFAIMILSEASVEYGSRGALGQRDFPSPKGHPDLFAQYHHDIRTLVDGTNGYPMGYRIKEFEKALTTAKSPVAKLNWRERGPGNVGGRTRALLVDPEDSHTWWAGSVSGGLWKTTNGGTKWGPLTELLPNLSVSSLAMAESNPDIIYMGTGEGMAGAGAVAGDGIFKSFDRGKTWIHLTSTVENDDFRYVNRLSIDPSDPDVVLAATDRGIFRSTDGGESWEHTWRDGKVQDLRTQPGHFDLQIGGLNGRGMLVSTDAGLTWKLASGDYVDRVHRVELAYSPSDPNIAYAAVEGSLAAQLYRSDDGGLNWVPTTEPSQTSINWLGGQGWFDNTLAVHPFNPDIVFVGGIHLWRIELSGEKTTRNIPGELADGGSGTWLEFLNIYGAAFEGRAYYDNHYALNIRETDYSNIEIRFGQGSQKAHRFWVSETAGFYSDGGRDVSFSEYEFADYVDVPFQVWDVDNNRQLMISFRDQAEDGEFNLIEPYFTTVPGNRDRQSYEFIFIHKYDYHDFVPDRRIARTGGVVDGMLYGLLPVLAGGATWAPASLPNQTVTLELKNINLFVRSTDGGIDINTTAHVDHHGIYPLQVNTAEKKFWILNTNDGGVAVSKDNGRTFLETDRAYSGYNTSQVYGMAKAPGSSTYIAGFQDNGTWMSNLSPTDGAPWRESVGADGIETIWHATDENKILATTQYGAVFRTVDGGGRWRSTRPYDTANGLFITSIDNHDLAPDDVYLVKRNGIWISRDFGATWTQKPIQESWGAWDGCKVRVSIADPDVVWAGCGLHPDRVLHVSKDRAVSFEPVAPLGIDNRFPFHFISGLATHPSESGTAYALFSFPNFTKILETKDYGQTWRDLSGFSPASLRGSTNGFPDAAVFDIVVMPHATNVLWAGTEIGIFVSSDGGAEWSYADNGLPAVSVYRMKIRDDELIVGTHGRGVWTLSLSEIAMGTEELASELPSGFSLSQNYPNPFNALTNIEFSVHQESHVRLAVFDVAGRKVSELTDQVYAPGVHRLWWNANAYSSGVYLYRMELNGRIVHTRRMTLAK